MSGNTGSPEMVSKEFAEEDRTDWDIHVVIVGPRVRKRVPDPRHPARTCTYLKIYPRHVVYSGDSGHLQITNPHFSVEENGEKKVSGGSDLSPLTPKKLKGWNVEVIHYFGNTSNTYSSLSSAVCAKIFRTSKRQSKRKAKAKKRYAADFKPIRDRARILAAAIELEDERSPRVDAIFLAKKVYGVEIYQMANEDRERLTKSIDRLVASLVEDGMLEKILGGFGVKTSAKSISTLYEW